MPNYAGRVSPPSSTRNFQGVSYPSSELNQNPNGAIENVNCDLTNVGSITLRKGWQQICDFSAVGGCDGAFLFVAATGAESRFVISGGKVWSVVGAVKTEVSSTGCTITPGIRWRGVQWKDKIWIANGVDQPLVLVSGTPFVVKTMAQVSADEHTTSKLPSSWGANPPIGFRVVNRGQDERMYSWNNTVVNFSTLGSATDFLTGGTLAGSGYFVVSVADGDSIEAVVSKFGYIVVFTRERTLIYTGDGPGDDTTVGITLSHILEIGCPGGPDSIVNVGTDTYFWSDFGPANLIRLLNATELSTNLAGIPVQPHVMNKTNRSRWGSTFAYHDIQRRRVIWFASLAGATLLNVGYVYQYDVKAWYRYEGWALDYIVTSQDGSVYAGIQQGALKVFGSLHTGTYDGALDITGYYDTVPYDWGQPDVTKTVPFIDVFSRNDVNTVTISYRYDFGRIEGSESLTTVQDGGIWGHLETDSDPRIMRWGPAEDAVTVGTWGGEQVVNNDRVDIYGEGKFLSFRFTITGHGNTEILGWKPSPRMKGLR